MPAGDYQLIVKSYNTNKYDCGFYSISGLLNQKSAMIEGLPGSQGLTQGASTCEIRGDPATSIIYKSSGEAKGGNEDFIDDDGSYYKYFRDILIVKSHREVLEPWTQEIQFEVKQK